MASFHSSTKHELNYAKKIKDDISMLQMDPDSIGDIEDPTEDQQLTAVKKNGQSIRLIIQKGINPSEEVKLWAIKNDPSSIAYIKDAPEEWKIKIASQFKEALLYIDNPSEEVQLAAIKLSTLGIHYLIQRNINISERVQIEALKISPLLINTIPNPTKKAKKIAMEGIKKLQRKQKNFNSFY